MIKRVTIMVAFIIVVSVLIFGIKTAYASENVQFSKDPKYIMKDPLVGETNLTYEEFSLICGIVMHEGNGIEMYTAITQCIKNAMDLYEWSAKEVIDNLYGDHCKEWSDTVEWVVLMVFSDKLKVTDEPILFYYAEDLCYSEWHETQDYVFTILNTRFFKLCSSSSIG